MNYTITFLIVVLGFLVGDFLNIQIKAAIERKQERDASNVHEILMALNKEFNSKFTEDKEN
jgi:hypothetical protein|tara:strand:+ start:841 stop:1023 length:183 start_codon:yes stop_codon:yes gene_type:complete